MHRMSHDQWLSRSTLDSQRRNIVFLSFNAKLSHGHPGHGPHWPGIHKLHHQEGTAGACYTCCAWSRKTDSQPILLSHWLFWGVPHCYGCVFSLLYILSNSYFALVLHPHHKLSYFKSAGWTPEWIETAEELVRTVFQGSYASHSVVDDTRDAREAQETDKVRVGTVLCILTVNPTF